MICALWSVRVQLYSEFGSKPVNSSRIKTEIILSVQTNRNLLVVKGEWKAPGKDIYSPRTLKFSILSHFVTFCHLRSGNDVTGGCRMSF